MREEKLKPAAYVWPPLVVVAGILLWAAMSRLHIFPPSAFPAPLEVARGFSEEVRHGLVDNIIASVYRVTMGFAIATLCGLPLGLWLGLDNRVRLALLPIVNFFRSLSPLAWIPFAILWFGLGDRPTIFLIFMASIFPITLATAAAVMEIPSVTFRVARDYGFRGLRLLTQVTLPGIAPQVITAMRVTAGLSWVVVVAAEMLSGKEGLGFAIWDARNSLRMDLLVVNMVVIGIIGVALDRLLAQLTKIPSVRWGYEQ
jgi:NitT/TauT family transport system permease protein